MDWLKATWQRYSHPTDEEREIRDQAARLIDSVNRLMLFVALMMFYFLLIPILYKVEQSTTKTANEVQRSADKLEALEQQIKQRMKEPEQWDNLKSQMTVVR